MRDPRASLLAPQRSLRALDPSGLRCVVRKPGGPLALFLPRARHGLWLASVLSGTVVSAQDLAATRLMHDLGASSLSLSLRAISIVPALLPVIALREMQLSAAQLGLVFTCVGVGSLAGAVMALPYLRPGISANAITSIAMAIVAGVLLAMAFARESRGRSK